ncbi:MAG TPA: hypothetical protein VHQ64_16385 [Pyrinomonadaceae bacterium]|jgi:hypothetical protein|nr:hypothetical protein [Pyrinomonadaceae bacterium]
MSDTVLKFIPTEPFYIPDARTHANAVALLEKLVPEGEMCEAEVYEHLTFIGSSSWRSECGGWSRLNSHTGASGWAMLLAVGTEVFRVIAALEVKVMSPETSRHWWYFISGIFALLVAGQAIHWFITAESTGASSARWWAVAAQAVLGSGVAVWSFLRARSLRREN